jgi:hypothetical protein
MIRKYKLLTKGGIMDQEMKQAIETFKNKVFEDYAGFNSRSINSMYKDTTAKTPSYQNEVNKRIDERLQEFKDGFKMVETKYYYKFLKANGSGQSVHSFIVKEDREIRRKHWKKGDLLMAATFSQPALNKPRGNILGEYKVQWTGPLYLSGPRGFTL